MIPIQSQINCPHAHYCRFILDSSICLAEKKNLYISDLYCMHNMLPLSHCLCFVSLDNWRESRMLMKLWKVKYLEMILRNKQYDVIENKLNTTNLCCS